MRSSKTINRAPRAPCSVASLRVASCSVQPPILPAGGSRLKGQPERLLYSAENRCVRGIVLIGKSMDPTDETGQPAKTDDQQSYQLLEEAFSRYQNELLGTLYYLVGNIEDARDALQEAFLKCWRRRQSVAEIENLKAWIFRIALNVGRDIRSTAWRRRRKPLPDDQSMISDHDSPPDADLIHQEQVALVRRALLDLRPEEQEVFLLRQNGEMTYDEIARSINIPTGTVKTRMRLALGKLREALQPKISDER